MLDCYKTNTFHGLQQFLNNQQAHQRGRCAHCHLVRSGLLGYGYLRLVGVDGSYWSCSGNVATNAYYLTFDALTYSSYGPHDRYFGFSLRCLQE